MQVLEQRRTGRKVAALYVQIPVELSKRLRKQARARGESLTAYATRCLDRGSKALHRTESVED